MIYTFQDGATSAFTNVDFVNDLYTTTITAPSIRTLNIDTDLDGKNDVIQAKIQFFADTTSLTNMQLFLFFNYGFRTVVSLQMQDFVRIDLTAPSGISKAYITGTLNFKQIGPIQSSIVARKIYNQSIFEDPTQNYDIMSIVSTQFNRNESLYCDCDNIVVPGSLSNSTEIVVTFNIPPSQQILYYPTLLENLKFAWVQYIALFIPIFFIIHSVLQFAFRNKIFSTQEINNLPVKKLKTY